MTKTITRLMTDVQLTISKRQRRRRERARRTTVVRIECTQNDDVVEVGVVVEEGERIVNVRVQRRPRLERRAHRHERAASFRRVNRGNVDASHTREPRGEASEEVDVDKVVGRRRGRALNVEEMNGTREVRLLRLRRWEEEEEEEGECTW